MDAAYRYRATVRKVIDGDTFVLDVDLGFRCAIALNIRVHGYDAPEMHGEEMAHGIAARAAAETLLKSGTIVIESFRDARSFERWVADVWVDGVLLGEAMTAAGYVKGKAL